MPSVIKATDRPRGAQAVSFNFDDLAKNADKYLDKVREEAQALLVQARADAQAIRRQAELDGRADAERSVEERLDRKLAEQLKTLTPALRGAIERIEQSRTEWLNHWERSAVRLAAAMASRVARRELTRSPEAPLALVREALELASGQGQVRVALNPADHAALGGQVAALAAEFSSLGSIEAVADAELSPGGCRVETRFGVIDQSFEAQLERLTEELT